MPLPETALQLEVKETPLSRHKKIHTAAGIRKIYSRVLVSAHRIGRGITPELVWQFIRPDELNHTQQRYHETDYFDMAKVLSVFGIKQTAKYPFKIFRSAPAMAALAVSNRRALRNR